MDLKRLKKELTAQSNEGCENPFIFLGIEKNKIYVYIYSGI